MSREDMRRGSVGRVRSRIVVVVGGLAIGAGVAVGGWLGTDHLEKQNEFCNACHLDGWISGRPLHTKHRDQFAATSPTSLAGAHAVAGNEVRPTDAAFRCIDCHGGVGFAGKARVKVLAAKDAFWWAVGDFEEPEGMHWPLLEQDCRKCHSSFAVKAGEFDDPAFHDLGVHNQDLGVDCVECHKVHAPQLDPNHPNQLNRWFIDASQVREQCARCHSAIAN